ncbi:MAG: hypothetical protein MZV49_25815 [Rhodopseudomonas palustris]|nr:hypothetical protein [Rhodopseudomonas palustris]
MLTGTVTVRARPRRAGDAGGPRRAAPGVVRGAGAADEGERRSIDRVDAHDRRS